MPTLTRDSLRAGFTVAPRLAITPANENRCESRAVQRDAGDRFVRWRPTVTEQVTVTRGASDTVLTRYELYAFNPRGKQTGDAQCVLRRGTAATTFMRGFFARPGRPEMVGVLAAQTATPVPEGVPPVFIGAGSTCLLDVWSWQMQCGNTTCYPQFALRVPTRTQRLGLVSDTATRAGGPASPLIGGWECPGMGNLSLNGDGTLTFHPDGGGGGGGGGGGSCGGGNGGGGGDSSGDGSVNPPGSGGGATSWWGASCDTILLDMPLECLPQSDPTCYLPLRSADSVSLVQAFLKLRKQAEFASPTDWSVCLELFNTLTSLYFVKKAVFRGKPDSTEGHDGQLVRDTLHIDTDYLDFVNANRTGENLANLLGLALHEAGHSIRKADGSAKYEHSSNLQPGSYPFPFNLTSPDVAGGIPNSCAKP